MSDIQGLATARSINAVRYLECSAKHNRGVNECFEQAAKVAMSGKHKNRLSQISADRNVSDQFPSCAVKSEHDKNKNECIIL